MMISVGMIQTPLVRGWYTYTIKEKASVAGIPKHKPLQVMTDILYQTRLQ